MNFKFIPFVLLLMLGISYNNVSKAQCSVNYHPYAYTYSPYMAINAFTLASVASNNPGMPYGSWNSFSTPVRSLTIGNTYAYTATVGSSTWYALAFAIWIDLNNNNIYESSEMLSSLAGSYSTSKSGNITIPLTATAATNVRMRIRSGYTYNSSFTGSQACTDYPMYGYSETEDYFVNLVAPCYAPTITAQPQHVATCESSSASYSVTTSGTGVSYQWETRPTSTAAFTAVGNGSTYSGATSNSLTVNNVPANLHGSDFRCKTTSNCGVAGYTDTVKLNVTPLAKVASQRLGDTICTTVDKVISFTQGGDVNNYQWQMGTLSNGFVDLQNVAPFNGVNSQYLEITGTPDSLNGQSFRCVFGGSCNQTMTEPISLYVIFPPYFSKEPADDTVFEGAAANFNVEVQNNTSFVYQWQASSNGGQSYSNISNDALYANYNTSSLTVLSSMAKSDWLFRCVIRSNDRLCGKFNDTSAPAKIVLKYPTSVASVGAAKYITISPNPVANNLLNMIATDELKNQDVKTIITDRLGRTVLSHEVSFRNNAASIDVTSLTPGIYYIKMQKGGELLEGNYSFVKQ